MKALSWILLACFGATAAVSLLAPLNGYDFFWHLATGRWILDHGSVPTLDPFTFTAGSPDARDMVILRGYWLCQVFYAILWERLGAWGIVALRGIVLGAVPAVIGAMILKRGGGILYTVVCLCPLLHDLRLRLCVEDRPQQWTFLLFTILLLLLERVQDPDRKDRTIVLAAALPLVMLVWGNMHPGFILGDIVILCYVLGEALQWRLGTGRGGGRVPFLVGACVALGISVVNPAGWGVISALRTWDQSLYASAVLESLPVLRIAQLGFFGIWGFVAAAVAFIATAIRYRRNLRAEHWILSGGLAIMAFQHIRFAIFFTIFITILVPPLWKSAFKERCGSKAFTGSMYAVAIVVLFAIAAQAQRRGTLWNRPVVEEGMFPVAAVKFLKRFDLPQRIFNPYEWGGYIIAIAPDYRVFIDGRGLRGSDDRMPLEYQSVMGASTFLVRGVPEWKAILDKYGVKVCVLPRQGIIRKEPPRIAGAMAQDGTWNLVYRDDKALIFVHRGWSFPVPNQGSRENGVGP